MQDLPDECLPRILARSRQAESEPEPESAAALRETMRRHRWNVSAAARELGVSRPTMYCRMRLLGIEARSDVSQRAAGSVPGWPATSISKAMLQFCNG